jgi:hypothetical protein
MPTYIIYYTQGNSNGPFDIYLSGSSGLNLYASNIPKYELVNGFTVTFPDGIPSSSVDVFDVSYGCFTDNNIPFPSVSPSITPSISITPTRTPSITVSPSITPSITLTPSVTPSFTPPPSITRTPTVTITPSRTSNISNSPTPTPSITRTPSASAPPNYSSFGTTLGDSAAYQACVTFNTLGFNGGWIYTVNPPGIVVGARIYRLDGFGNYNPLVGGDQWYAMGAWFLSLPSACQIDDNGYITNITYLGCLGI